mmetsp:Transcript_40818/g.97302  ORF Transcript_40818/g.97302 Transcript_40818/m.97302 type:complete len:115 (+) Transcript_40818:433-777(+)
MLQGASSKTAHDLFKNNCKRSSTCGLMDGFECVRERQLKQVAVMCKWLASGLPLCLWRGASWKLSEATGAVRGCWPSELQIWTGAKQKFFAGRSCKPDLHIDAGRQRQRQLHSQ